MKKWILFVFVLCFGFGDLFSQNVVVDDPITTCWERVPLFFGINTTIISSNLISNNIVNGNYKFNYGYGFNIEDFSGNPKNLYSSLKYGFNFTNLGYELQKDNVDQNYELSYLSTNVSYKRLLFDSQFYVIGGVNLNYLYDVESEIEILNNNNEKIKIKKDLNGAEINNNYNRFDLVGSIGFGYEILMKGYYLSIEPKYNFSFLNHINENNQALKGMNFKNEFWSLNFGVSFPL